jgi:hypothetical protein
MASFLNQDVAISNLKSWVWRGIFSINEQTTMDLPSWRNKLQIQAASTGRTKEKENIMCLLYQ